MGNTLDWNKLLHNGRRKDKSNAEVEFGEGRWGLKETVGIREEIERDYDRILFLAPTRRLSDKTQVFPLEQNDSVRTRLTHSYEVSNLARSIGTQLAYENANLFSDIERDGKLTRTLPSLLAAIGLAHDLGNPPFGHQGESAIQDWFSEHAERIFPKEEGKHPNIYQDFIKFDGNSQTMRLLTQLQVLNDKFGINLTYSTLAAMIKYPQSSAYVAKQSEAIQTWEEDNKNSLERCPHAKPTWKKHGYFYSEAHIVEDIWNETGLREGVRHPITYIMEACDDIAYSVLDAEDIVKKGLASFHDLMNHLTYYMECARERLKNDVDLPDDEKETSLAKLNEKFTLIETTIESSKKKHKEFSEPSLDLTPAELNDVSMQMFRVFAIGKLVSSVTESFVDNSDRLMNPDQPIKDLMSISRASELCEALKNFDFKWGYKNKSVLKLELKGHNYIHSLMDMLWVGIHGRLNTEDSKDSKTPFGEYAYGRISENYRRVFEDASDELPEEYKEAQLLTDAISGMTDSYLIDLHDELKALYE